VTAAGASVTVIADRASGASGRDRPDDLRRLMDLGVTSPIVFAGAGARDVIQQAVRSSASTSAPGRIGARRARVGRARAGGARSERSPADVRLSVVGVPPSRALVAWATRRSRGSAARVLDLAALARIDRRLPALAARTVCAGRAAHASSRRRRSDRDGFLLLRGGGRARTCAAVPLVMNERGIERIVVPVLDARERRSRTVCPDSRDWGWGWECESSARCRAHLGRGRCDDLRRGLDRAASLIRHVRFLAADDLQGRGNGAPDSRAADTSPRGSGEAGLEPRGENGSFFQPFELVTGLDVKPGNAMTVEIAARRATFALGEDYYPLSLEGAGGGGRCRSCSAGSGSAPALKYDDYDGIDVTGKAVLVFAHEPQEDDEKSAFDGRTNSTHAAVMQKARVGARNARLLIIIATTHTRPARPIRADGRACPGRGIRRRCRPRLARRSSHWLDRRSIFAHRGANRPRSRRSPANSPAPASATQRLERIRKTVRNVVGVLPGGMPRCATKR
jgi:hypothetical protein